MPKEKSAGAIVFRMEPPSPGAPASQGNSVPYYLLLHYGSGHWEFAKGHIEPGESEEETVKREIFEETGINDLVILPGFKKYIKYFFRKYKEKTLPQVSETGHIKLDSLESSLASLASLETWRSGPKRGAGGWIFKLVAFFVAETKIKDVKISNEHTGFVWLPIEEAIKKTTFKNSKMLLREANDFIKKAV